MTHFPNPFRHARYFDDGRPSKPLTRWGLIKLWWQHYRDNPERWAA